MLAKVKLMLVMILFQVGKKENLRWKLDKVIWKSIVFEHEFHLEKKVEAV